MEKYISTNPPPFLCQSKILIDGKIYFHKFNNTLIIGQSILLEI